MNKIRTALFDMDGVLYDSMKNHAYAYKVAGNAFGIEITEETVYECEGMKGTVTMKNVASEQLQRSVSDEEAREMYEEKCRVFRSLPPAGKVPGVECLLNTMEKMGIRICVVTGSGQLSLLERLADDFKGLIERERIVCAKDYKNGKPAPDPYLMGLEVCGSKASETIVIENAPLGVKAGKAAGIFTVAVNTGPLSRTVFEEAGADLIFNNMKEVEQWIQDRQE